MKTETHFVVTNSKGELTSVCATARSAQVAARIQGNAWSKAEVFFADGDWHLAPSAREVSLRDDLEARRAERVCGK